MLTAPAHAQFDIFHRQAPPPADIPGGAPGDPGDPAGLVLRINQLEEELRRAYGQIEELQNAQHRLESAAAEVPPGRRIPFRRSLGRRAAELRCRRSPLDARPAGNRAETQAMDAFDPNADPNAPGAPRPLGTTPPSAPLVREARRWRVSSRPWRAA